jgi:hypothetical protein
MSNGFGHGGGEGDPSTSNTKFSSDYVINKNLNLTDEHHHEVEVQQVPFFLNIPGPPNIREKDEAYKAEK